ncbi:MAG: hypothetical protein ACTSUT_09830 [Promethearchaeota archaeon]
MKGDDDIDLSIDEFEEEDEKIPLKFEKRKAGKEDLADTENLETLECPFCGEIFDDLSMHIQTCEFAPDDASIEDIVPKKKKRKTKAKGKTATEEKKERQNTKKCPYCGKEFIRLGRHLSSCPKRPKDSNNKEE